jgi:hypothetical protein
MGYSRRCAMLIALFALASLADAAPAAAALPIPSLSLLVPDFVGAAATTAPVASFVVPQDPYLAPNGANSMHDDAYGTNSYQQAGPMGRSTRVTTALYGVEECATEAFDAAGRIVALCGDLSGPVLRLIDPVSLDIRATYALPGRNLASGANPLTDLCGGAYFYLDEHDRAVVATTDRRVFVVADTGTAFSRTAVYDLSSVVGPDDCLIALMPSWSGAIWFVTQGGTVGTIDPTTGAVHSTSLTGEVIANSFSVDETGSAYVVSDHALYRFAAGPDGAPTVIWRQAYDRGSQQKPGQLSQGSGTTPTLFGDGLVAITDNADPQMHVVVYRRDTGGEVCRQGVFAPGASDTENSLVAVGDSVIAENNYGYQGPQSTLLGHTTAPGIARVDVVAGQCRLAWTSDEVAPTSVPKVSLASGLLYAYTKPAKALGLDARYFTAIDVRTGRTAFSKLTGVGPQFNNHYASIYLGSDGSAYVATLAGMVRVRDTA